MEAGLFKSLGLRPGRYSPQAIDRQYRRVRQEILRGSVSGRQEHLDKAKVAQAFLRLPNHQAAILRRFQQGQLAVPASASAGIHRIAQDVAPRKRQTSDSPTAAAGRFDVHERFARMVLDHLESGLLRYTARRRLLLLAGGMGIGQFKANLIIAEVLHDQVQLPTAHPGFKIGKVRPQRSHAALLISAALALLLDAVLYLWLFA